MATDRFTASGFPAVDRAGDAERYIEYLDAQAATPFWMAAKRATIDALALPHGATALDVGCGTVEEVGAMAAILRSVKKCTCCSASGRRKTYHSRCRRPLGVRRHRLV